MLRIGPLDVGLDTRRNRPREKSAARLGHAVLTLGSIGLCSTMARKVSPAESEFENELASAKFVRRPPRERNPVPGGLRIPGRGILPRRSASLPALHPSYCLVIVPYPPT